MTNSKIDYEKILNIINKWFYSLYFPLVLLLLFYFVEIYLALIIYLSVVFYWFFKQVYVSKNKTEKYGIIFLLDDSTYYNYNRNLFFKKLSFILEPHFKISVIYKNCLKKYNSEEEKFKIMATKNYHMIINTFAMDVKDNDDCVWALDNTSVTFSSLLKLDEVTMNNLQSAFNNGFHKFIKLREKDSYNDINENTVLMANSIRYLVSIIFIMFGNLNEAERLLKEIDISNLDVDNKLVHYLKTSILERYEDIQKLKSSTN